MGKRHVRATAHATRRGGTLPFGSMEIRGGAKIAVLTDPRGAFFAIFGGEGDD